MIRTFHKRTEFVRVLRHRAFRRYYLGLLASVSAHQGMTAAQGWLVFELTGLPAALGFVAAAQAVPGIVLNLIAGALADRFDPRRIIMACEGFAGLLMVLLAALVVTGTVELWHIVAISFLTGVATSFDQPARRAVWPVLVPREEILYATSINQTVWNGTRVIAPAIATGIIAVVARATGDALLGAAASFAVLALGFWAMVFAMTLIRLPEVERAHGATVFHDIADGLAFAFRHRVVFLLLLMGFIVGYFGLSYQWLLPAFTEDQLGLGPEGLGLLLAANGAGGLVGVIGVASFGAYQNRTWLLLGGAVAFGVVVMLFGGTGVVALTGLAVLCAGAAGALYSLFQVAAGTMLTLLVPHHYRGRVMGLRGIMWSLAPLGALHSGIIATWAGTPFAIALGGAVVIVSTIVIGVASRDIRRMRQLAEEADAEAWAAGEGGGKRASTAQRPA